MKKLTVVLLASLLVTLILAVPASATRPSEVAGTCRVAGPPPQPPSIKSAGNNCTKQMDLPYSWAGDIDGTSTAHIRIVAHGPCPSSKGQYRENLKIQGTFTGYVNSRYGTFDYIEVLKFQPVPDRPDEPPYWYDGTGTMTILKGTGELANLHGVLRIEGGRDSDGESIRYQGTVHFDPK